MLIIFYIAIFILFKYMTITGLSALATSPNLSQLHQALVSLLASSVLLLHLTNEQHHICIIQLYIEFLFVFFLNSLINGLYKKDQDYEKV